MAEVFLGLGGNLGDRSAFLLRALTALAATPQVQLTRVSSVYETKAVGLTEQPDFLNLVVALHTSLSPEETLALCLKIESALGRVRRERWGPRVIDIDLLWHGGTQQSSATLTLPHPRMCERAFVLLPLAEIAPDLRIEPSTTAAELARGALGREDVRRIADAPWPMGGGQPC